MPRPRRDESDVPTTSLVDIAVRLLDFQQRLTAFDLLYDEEITGLTKELTQLKVDFLHHYKALPPDEIGAVKVERPHRSARSSKKRSKTANQRSAGSSTQKSTGSSAQKE